MKIDLKYTHIVRQNTDNILECFLDYSRQRTLYFFNVVKSVSCIESFFNDLEYDLELQQSSFSSSSYFTIINIKAKKSFTIRISDHNCPEFDSSDFNIDSKTGEFYINISIIKQIKNYLT
jgi:hypothetical protein